MTTAKKEKVGMNLEQDTKYLEKGRAKQGVYYIHTLSIASS